LPPNPKSTEDPQRRGTLYYYAFENVAKSECLPIEAFERHPRAAELLAEEPIVQAVFARETIAFMSGMRFMNGGRVVPCRVLPDAKEDNPRKRQAYLHYAQMWDVPRYPLAAALAVELVLRRDLPLTHDDLTKMCNDLAGLQMVVVSCQTYVPGLVRHLRRHVEKKGISLELSTAIDRLMKAMRLPDGPPEQQAIIQQLKALLKPAAGKKERAAVEGSISPEAEAARLFESLLTIPRDDLLASSEIYLQKPVLEALAAGPAVQVAFARLTLDRIGALREKLPTPRWQITMPDGSPGPTQNAYGKYRDLRSNRDYPLAATRVLERSLKKKLPFTTHDFVFMVNRLADLEAVSLGAHDYLPAIIRQLEKHTDQHGMSAELAVALQRLLKALDMPFLGADGRRLLARLQQMTLTT
jgi:hypothetical protein